MVRGVCPRSPPPDPLPNCVKKERLKKFKDVHEVFAPTCITVVVLFVSFRSLTYGLF